MTRPSARSWAVSARRRSTVTSMPSAWPARPLTFMLAILASGECESSGKRPACRPPSQQKVAPLSIGAEQLIRSETRLVLHRPAARDIVAEIDMLQAAPGGVLNQAQDVVGAQGAVAVLRVVEEIDRRETTGQIIGVANTDQLVAEVVAPLPYGKGIANERVDVAIFRLGPV